METVTNITEKSAAFVEQLCYEDIPEEALAIGRRCIVDTLGLYIAGTTEDVVTILVHEALDEGGVPAALLLASGGRKVPVGKAARVLATAGHAHDWDDTQVSHDPAHVYGLLTHPTVPPLTAALTMSQALGIIDGKVLMTAFLAGFEVETKISEWMSPDHYLRGHHSSGTVGTLGACISAAKLMRLTDEKLRHAIGIAASFAAGIRCNFGTMTKPLHVGRATENGITAARLAARGITADPDALDGRWGMPHVMSGGLSHTKAAQGFGAPMSIISPGVSIKPYPSGILTHPSMDAMLQLVVENDIRPEEIERIDFYAGSNILTPIRYPIAANHLQAKFSMAALLSMMALYRRAGRQEFLNAVVGGKAMQDMQQRVITHLDPGIEAAGFDKIRSRIEITTRAGRRFVQQADERYRGGPAKPMTDGDIAEKFRSCTAGIIDVANQDRMIELGGKLDQLDNISELVELIDVQPDG
ncbi:MmgE/PrpD family protein [Halomonas kalidii]|uniref:MmgE/PrpD family protein n=1 Tax=Halomonas kalidii TaxID=3043293 RepID=A0ABT6VQM8_9GAMM|nr:MmgE/PrpD family protein [Halomonas kalidii]MDI5935283.1 MmgE/PrpD family protein [Halomonas kalidii]